MSDTKIHPVLDEEKSMHERMANLPDIPELPQCTCQTLAISHNPAIPPKKVLCLVCSAFQEMNITREELATMRAAAGRCAELEVLADGRSEALDVAIGKINKAEAALAEIREALSHDTGGATVAGFMSTKDLARGMVDNFVAWKAKAERLEAQRDEARRELGRALMDMAAGIAGITPGVE